MSFNTPGYAIVLPSVFIVYWVAFGRNVRLQNVFILVVSYVFYGLINWKLLSLLFITTLIDYFAGLVMARQGYQKNRRLLLVISIAANLALLGFFKYYNFFTRSFAVALSWAGLHASFYTLQVILPVGISFYTFQSMSYTIDVYRCKIKPTHDFINYAAFVSFFPQLLAGPIERASKLIPQFQAERRFDAARAANGLKQMLWGYFKKIVIADNCARVADMVFDNPGHYHGASVLLAAVFFSIQLYGDFSGYSDIAIGSARLLGFELSQNFAFPYFSRNMSEFWRKWHMSLYSWFKDYVYIPLGGNRGSRWKTVRNIFIVFFLSGLWHGASWSFVLWGILNAIYFLPGLLTGHQKRFKEIVAEDRDMPSVRELLQMGVTFGLFSLSMIVFRAGDFRLLVHSMPGLLNRRGYHQAIQIIHQTGYGLFVLVASFFILEWYGRRNAYAIEQLPERLNPVFKYLIYYSIAMAILFWGSFAASKFIYFQF